METAEGQGAFFGTGLWKMGIVHSCYSEGALNEYLTDVVSSSML